MRDERRESAARATKTLSLSLPVPLPVFHRARTNPIVPNLADAALLRRGGHAKARAGGALGLQMNIFERVSRVVRSYVNAAITAAEDPEK